MNSEDVKIAFLKSLFGEGPINRGGIAVNCPSCSKENPGKKKLIIRIHDGAHHCWVCDLKGKTLKYTIKKYHFNKIKEYKRIYDDDQSILQEEEIIEKPGVPRGFLLLAQKYNSRDPDIRDTVSYAKSRGMTQRDFWKFKIGSCTLGKFKRRVIIPSFDVTGNLNYFVARSIDGKNPKYINARYPKKKLIFNEINLNWKKPITLVEGPFDLFKAGENSTCILGSSLNENYDLFQKIIQNSTPVFLALDYDVMSKAIKIAEKFHEYGIQLKLVDCRGYDDVGEMSKKEFQKRKNNATPWKAEHKLVHLITKLKSGSIF